MVIRSSGHEADSVPNQLRSQCLSVVRNLLLILPELRFQRLPESNCLSCNHMHQRSSLRAGKDTGIDLFGKLFPAQDYSPSRSAQCLVRCCRHNIGIWHGRRVNTGCHQPGNMRHIHHQISSGCVCNLTHFCPVNHTRISTRPGNHDTGFVFFRYTDCRFIIDGLCIRRYTVKY